jgi:hypothetical protein
MFWLITSSGRWLTSVPNSIIRAEIVSAYTLQNITLGLLAIKRLKLDTARNTLKFFFTQKKLPQPFSAFNSMYKNTRWFVIKISGFLKPIVSSKKSATVLASLSTATLAVTGGLSFPIILLGTGFTAYATYHGEKKKEALLLENKKLTTELTTLQNLYKYEQKCSQITLHNTNGEKQTTAVTQELHHTNANRFLEITKIGFDLTLAGIVCGVSNFCFMLTGGVAAYTIFSEIQSHYKIKSMKKEIGTLQAKLGINNGRNPKDKITFRERLELSKKQGPPKQIR